MIRALLFAAAGAFAYHYFAGGQKIKSLTLVEQSPEEAELVVNGLQFTIPAGGSFPVEGMTFSYDGNTVQMIPSGKGPEIVGTIENKLKELLS